MEKTLFFSVKHLMLLALALGSRITNAQIEAGLWFFETSVGDFHRDHSKYSDGIAEIEETYSNVSLYPVIGYMAGEHIAFGVRLKTGFEKAQQTQTEANFAYEALFTRNTLSLEPFMRIYFPTAHYRTRPYIQLGAGKGYMSSRDEFTSKQGALTESQQNTRHDEYLQLDGELGLNYLLAPNIAISSGVGYYLMYGKFDYNRQQGGTHSAQQSFTRNGDSSRSSMLWRLGFSLFL